MDYGWSKESGGKEVNPKSSSTEELTEGEREMPTLCQGLNTHCPI